MRNRLHLEFSEEHVYRVRGVRGPCGAGPGACGVVHLQTSTWHYDSYSPTFLTTRPLIEIASQAFVSTVCCLHLSVSCGIHVFLAVSGIFVVHGTVGHRKCEPVLFGWQAFILFYSNSSFSNNFFIKRPPFFQQNISCYTTDYIYSYYLRIKIRQPKCLEYVSCTLF